MVTGLVLRRHAGGYFVYAPELDTVLQCPLRARLKKEGVSVVTGDRVELDELEAAQATAVICARLERRNLLTRPYLANLDQVFIVQSIHEPEWNSLLCDRYLVHLQLELDHIEIRLLVNKCDLASRQELEALRKIYEPLGYKIVFVSAKTEEGLSQLRHMLEGRSSVLLGPSGVGKSSIINALVPGLNLKVDIDETFVGRHTTTHIELYKVAHIKSGAWITDTPGFNLGELNYPQPADVAWQFPEIVELAPDCKYSNCLHVVEEGCNVVAKLDRIAETRYASYQIILADSQEAARIQSQSSKKVESGTVKTVGGNNKSKVVPKLSEKFRAGSRRRDKQSLRAAARNAADEEPADGKADSDQAD